MMPYRMFEGQDTPNLHGAAKEQALRELMAQGYSREAAENMLADMRAKSLASEMSAFRNQTSGEAPPWSPAMQNAFITGEDLSRFRSGADARMTGEASPSSYGDIYPREQLEPVVDTASRIVPDQITVGAVDGVPVYAQNDATSSLVQDVYPSLQRGLGAETGYAVGRGSEDLLEGALASSPAEPEDVYSLLQHMGRTGKTAYENVGRDMTDLANTLGISPLSPVQQLDPKEVGRRGEEVLRNISIPLTPAGEGLVQGVKDVYSGLSSPNQTVKAALESILQTGGEGAAKVGDYFRSLPDPSDSAIASYAGGLFGPRDKKPSGEIGEATRVDIARVNKPKLGEAGFLEGFDPDLAKMITAGEAGGAGEVVKGSVPVQEPTDARSGALTTAVTNVGTGAETEEDTEGLLKGLFGRSYKPMDDGALALINLGAGIAKGDITGGMQSAVTAMGEERDRRRKEDLSSAQAEFFRSGEKGASKASMLAMREKAVRTIEGMKHREKTALLSQILGTKPTREQMDDPVLQEEMIALLATRYAQQEKISARSGALQNPSQLAGNRGTGNNTVDKARFVQQHNMLTGQ